MYMFSLSVTITNVCSQAVRESGKKETVIVRSSETKLGNKLIIGQIGAGGVCRSSVKPHVHGQAVMDKHGSRLQRHDSDVWYVPRYQKVRWEG